MDHIIIIINIIVHQGQDNYDDWCEYSLSTNIRRLVAYTSNYILSIRFRIRKLSKKKMNEMVPLCDGHYKMRCYKNRFHLTIISRMAKLLHTNTSSITTNPSSSSSFYSNFFFFFLVDPIELN